MKTTPRAKNVLKAISLFKKGLKPMEIASVLKTAPSNVYNALAYHGAIKVKSPMDKVVKQQKMLRNRLRKAETMLRNLRRLF